MLVFHEGSKYIPLLSICSFTLGKRNAVKEQRSAVEKFCSVVIQVPWHKVYKKLQRSQTQSYLSAGSENQWSVAACRFSISPTRSSSPAIIALPIRKELMGPYLKQKVTVFLLASVSRRKYYLASLLSDLFVSVIRRYYCGLQMWHRPIEKSVIKFMQPPVRLRWIGLPQIHKNQSSANSFPCHSFFHLF